jgi:EAL and modified HD-GYP domain-containing signal transduction protein
MSHPPEPASQIFVARQPILDSHNRVFGYELLYRAAPEHTKYAGSVEVASARVLNDALLSLGLDTLTAGRLAFVNLSRKVLLTDAATLIPPAGIVLELLEDIPADSEVVAACKSLNARGYALALDDFVPGSDAEKLLPYAKFVKMDVLALDPSDMKAAADRLLKQGLRLIAEKVESANLHDAARAAGCSHFQGYYFCRPRTFSVGAMSANQVTQIRLLAALNQPEASFMDVEALVKRDASLSYRVLRCVNSAAFGVRREVHSIREALQMLGLSQIRKWASIWSLVGVNGGSPELVTLTILRARCCELLGANLDDAEASEYFLLGLCSLLDAILGVRMDAAIDDLPLAAEARDALLGHENRSRHLLDAVTHYERGAWELAAASARRIGLKSGALPEAYSAALAWSHELQDMATAA